MKAIAYLQFDGKAEEALTFYEKALQATNVKKVRFGAFGQDPNASLTEEEQNMIMESRIEFSGNILMISDVLPSMQAATGEITKGNTVLISIIDADPEMNKQSFEKLLEGGTVIMPLSSTPWSASFGMLVDKFGVMWKFNSEASKFLDSFVN
ncbi:VOC family protein [Lysinibacillus xylanilyticus]|uniref:Glyoxalase/bleomycin resistance/extradiol dioxygenase family protein n=1 Tax=Lysinibacillus xylanilyticus TaxID=582475 RepID=A0ABT4EZP9_9BACI|nr:glyoxalase/bleomycin resistance/extradiol dioxygenase family protein [Lysinibacillus xylanilyticus]MCY9549766.1 glyoxalase/bleomycin resistance/extradiol dioxygenase family protein [Lysinibacillus xylanilyticus]MED3803626.1 glyoxalase/bleomycin resistance/extradiol dioxygenase family protein [Lysinibacillus xylanilyticus]